MIAERGPRPAQLVGEGAARALLARSGFASPLVVVDPAVLDRAEALLAERPGIRLRVHDRPTDLDSADELARDGVAAGADGLIAIGGGNVLDLVTLAAAEATNPRVLRSLGARAAARGFLSGIRLSAAPLAIAAIPTTVGTGSEVNGSACFETTAGSGPVKTLVALPGATPRIVAYDPEFSAGPSDLVRSGVVEIGARLVGAAIGTPSRFDEAEREAEAAFDRLTTLAAGLVGVDSGAGGDPDADTRLSIAVLSADSHSGWALRGRGPAPSPLWLLATEVSVAASLSKNEATMLLVGPWLEAVASGDDRWGSPEALARWTTRLADLGGGSGARDDDIHTDLIDWFRDQASRVTVRNHPAAFDPAAVARRLERRFRIGSLSAIDPAAVTELLAGALLEPAT